MRAAPTTRVINVLNSLSYQYIHPSSSGETLLLERFLLSKGKVFHIMLYSMAIANVENGGNDEQRATQERMGKGL